MFDAVLLACLVLIGMGFLAVGIPLGKGAPNLTSFFLYDGHLRLRWFVTSISATNLSLGNFVVPWAVMGLTFGWPGLVISVVVHLAIILGYIVFSPALAKYIDAPQTCGSVHEYLYLSYLESSGARSSRFLRFSAALPTIVGLLLALVLELYIAASLIERLAGYDFFLAFVALTALITVYSAWAGYKAVVGTDTLQLIFFFITVLGAVFALTRIDPSTLNPKLSSWGGIFKEAKSPDLATVISFIVLGFGWLIVAMDVWQRNCATRNHKSSLWGNVSGMIIIFLLSLGFLLLGMIDRAAFLPYIENGGGNPIDPVTDFLQYGKSVGGGPIAFCVAAFAAALVTAALSTADTFLVVCGHAIMADFLVGGRRRTTYSALPDEDSRVLTILGRVIITILGVIVIVIGSLFHVFELWKDPYTVFFIAYGVQFALLAALVFGSFTKYRNARAAGTSIILTVVVTVGVSLFALGRATAGEPKLLGIDAYTVIYLMPTAAALFGFLSQALLTTLKYD